MMKKEIVLYNRLKRQGLLYPIVNPNDEQAYLNLFKRLQPVSPIFFTMPGNPPNLVHRTVFNDTTMANKLRSDNKIIKARFNGGRIGYIIESDLELYARAFRKPLNKSNLIQEEVLSYIKECNGVMKDQLKEDLSIPNPLISRALKRLQEAFLVYETQLDGDWDTAWFDFESEWMKLEYNDEKDVEAIKQIILVFIEQLVVANLKQIKSWSELNIKTLKNVLHQLETDGLIKTVSFDNATSYILVNDLNIKVTGDIKSVYMLDKSDYLVRANLTILKEKYKGKEVLQYLLIDGEFKGAVCGHWGFGSYPITDVVLDISDVDAENRHIDILSAIRKYYTKEEHTILQYNGKPCKEVK